MVMLRTVVYAVSVTAALADVSAASSMFADLAVDLDVASHDPIDAVFETSSVGNALTFLGRQLAEIVASTATSTSTTAPKKPAGASGPGQMGISALRFKLSQSYCPTASEVEKQLLACKNFEISRKVRTTKDEQEKKKLVESRKALYAAASKKSDAEKKQAASDHKQLYQKAYSKYCATAPTSDVCTHELMKQMYGSATPVGAKKLKKKKKAL